MPWTKDSLPPSVKEKDWDDEKKTKFARIASTILKETGDEGKAISIATAQVENGQEVDTSELLKGMAHEIEHGKKAGNLDVTHDDLTMTAKIALEHLKDNPKYYSELEGIEKRNAHQFPKRYFAKHMRSGIAGGYAGDESLFIDDDCIAAACKSFEGKPVYVNHQDVKLSTLQEDADGYVVKSFFNKNDGWFWAEIIAVSDKAHAAILQGWAVSNAYIPLEYGDGGQHLGVDYDKKVINAEFTHLAIVPNPRYESSVILSPDEFKAYNEKKIKDIHEVTNSKTTNGANIMSLFGKIFKMERVEVLNAIPDGADISAYEVEVDGKMKPLSEVVNAVKKNMEDEEKLEKDEEKLNDDTEVSVGDKKMTLKELMNRYSKVKKNEGEDDDVENEGDEEEKQNSHFDDLANAGKNITVENSFEVMEGRDARLARAKKLISI
jgi:uncharacterized protein YdaT